MRSPQSRGSVGVPAGSFGLRMLLYGSLVGHFLGCACRPGPIHTPTDYRIADWLILSQAQSYTLPHHADELGIDGS